MSDSKIPPSETIPAGWQRDSGADARCQWLHDDLEMVVSVTDISAHEFLVIADQYLTADGNTTRVTTHGASFGDIEQAYARALDVMIDASDEIHLLDCVCALEHEDAIDFVCVYRDAIPESVEYDEIEAFVRAHLGDGDPAALERDAEDFVGGDAVTIDVFPRPLTHVVSTDDVDVGDPTVLSEQADEVDFDGELA